MSRETLTVWLMPWAELPAPLKFGEIEIWDFYKDGPKRVSDSQEMLWLAQLMSCFIDRHGQEMKNISVLQLGQESFGQVGSKGNKKIRWAIRAMAFSFLAESISKFVKNISRSIGVNHSERFQSKCLVIDEEGNLHYSEPGKIGCSELAGKHVEFREPQENECKIDCIDSELLFGLANINDNQFESALWRKLGVCFEWFMAGWTASPEVSHPARYISLMTSFESLARQENTDKAPRLADYASTLCHWNALPKTEALQQGKKLLQVNKPSKFIFDYAGYRNAFVHGDTYPYGMIQHIVDNEKFQPRMVMSMVIYCMVMNILIQEDVFDETQRVLAELSVKAIPKIFHWDTETPITPSPHLDYMEED